ncbi:hypothetical protein [Paenirhodobacter populi]|uniref:hypothetical protein n=1 Tax=Paenirhodobacter populi TaxID=2306993 RepID=UPI000FE34584|nr:hypothetical protein [Sinirhodobacter populi]RWR07323.1 hypothetical protein D2T32_11645 [Sinirhodobacter populi]
MTTKKERNWSRCAKRLLAQIRVHQKLGTAVMFEGVDTELKQRIDSLIKELEDRITLAIASDDHLSETAGLLHSILGIGPVASSMLVAEMPEIGTITGEEAAALTGLIRANVSMDALVTRHLDAVEAAHDAALEDRQIEAVIPPLRSPRAPRGRRGSPPSGSSMIPKTTWPDVRRRSG